MAKRKQIASRNTEEKDRNGYWLYPTTVNERTWFYVSRKGVTMAHEFRDDKSGILFECSQIEIPWQALCEAVDLHRRNERRRAAKLKS